MKLCSIILCAVVVISQCLVESTKNIDDKYLHNGTTKRVVISDEDKKKAMDVFVTAMDAFVGHAIGTIPLGSTFYGLFKSILTDLKKDDKTLWQQIRNQVKESIDKSMIDVDLDSVDRELRKIERRIREGDLTGDDYRAAIDLMEEVFPHKREAIPWSDELTLRTLYYCTIIVQVYQIRIEQGDAEKCDLGKRLVEIREDVIYGMKEMVRKRYRQIQDKTYQSSMIDSANFTIGGIGEFVASILPDGEETKTVKSSTRYAGGGNEHFSNTYYTWKYQIKYIENKVVNFLMTEVVNKINNFFNQDLCFEGCECPEPITSNEIGLEWPTECLGANPEDETERCEIPCGKFGKDYDWCYDKTNWIYCKRTDIRCCIKMVYDTRPNRCVADKKKKTKKKTSKLLSKRKDKKGNKEKVNN